MKNSLRSLLLAGAAVTCISGTTPALASQTGPDPSQFSIIESLNQYTVVNGSTNWYVIGFEITHSPDASNPYSTQTDWVWSSCYGSCFGNNSNAFIYTDNNIANYLTNSILPGTSSGNFFYNGVAVSQYDITVTNGEVTYDVTGTATVTPLPAALPLFATGLGGLGLLGWRRKRKATAAIAA